MTGILVGFYPGTELVAIHPGHHDITDNNIGQLFCCHLQTFLTIFCLLYAVVVCQAIGDIHAHVTIIIDDQQLVCIGPAANTGVNIIIFFLCMSQNCFGLLFADELFRLQMILAKGPLNRI